MKRILLICVLLLLVLNMNAQTYGEGVTDIDGNEYPTVIIGGQEWMTENLEVTSFNDGAAINQATNADEWMNQSGATWCYHGYDSIYPYTNESRGKHYNFYVVSDSRNICPSGWSLPSDSDWSELTTYIASNGFDGTEGVALKANTGFLYTDAGTDNFNFSALDAGKTNIDGGSTSGSLSEAYWWSNTSFDQDSARYFLVSGYETVTSIGHTHKGDGLSIRCMRKITSDTVTYDTTTYFVTNDNFNLVVYLDSIDSLQRVNLYGDSIVYHYSKFEFTENVCMDSNLINDTVLIYDTITVLDTSELLISVEDTLNITLTISTGMDEIQDELKVWSDGSSIYFESVQGEGYSFDLVSITGSTVLDIDDTSSSNSISLNGILKGTYIAKFTSLTDLSVSITKKVVIR